ncbi:MAG: PmoA family protein [Verrucomicrobiae bacterium]|nr:PmoA family protein [Verrucomicrobiae bacterium]
MNPTGWVRAAIALGALAMAAREESMKAAEYTLAPDACGMTLKAPDGRVVFTYMTRKPEKTNLAANSTSCFHPVNTPSGERLTDLAPGDHHHHRGVFLAWHAMQFQWPADFSGFGPLGPTEGFNIERGDFWGWGQFAPTGGRVIVNKGIELAKADAERAELEIVDDWMIGGKAFMRQVTGVVVREEAGAYVMDLDYRLTPERALRLDHQAFGGFCVRARNDGESWYADGDGKVTLPDPHYSTPKLNWPARPWYDYTIALNSGKTVGCAVIEHPENPPSTWHNPRYVWMINPCIVAGGEVRVNAGEPLRLRYRLVIHDGVTPKALIERLLEEWKR